MTKHAQQADTSLFKTNSFYLSSSTPPFQDFSVTLGEKQEHQLTSKLNTDGITQLLKETLHY